MVIRLPPKTVVFWSFQLSHCNDLSSVTEFVTHSTILLWISADDREDIELCALMQVCSSWNYQVSSTLTLVNQIISFGFSFIHFSVILNSCFPLFNCPVFVSTLPPVFPSSLFRSLHLFLCQAVRSIKFILQIYGLYVYLITFVSGCLSVSFIFSLLLSLFSHISSPLSALLLLLHFSLFPELFIACGRRSSSQCSSLPLWTLRQAVCGSWPFCVEFSCSPCVCVGSFRVTLASSNSPKKCRLGLKAVGCLLHYVSPVMGRQPVQCVSCSSPNVSWDPTSQQRP